MIFQVGDICIDPAKLTHAMMIYEGGSESKARIIHGKNDGNFHVVPNMTQEGVKFVYLIGDTIKVFRPPAFDARRAAVLVTAATSISQRAKYGMFRAIRLWAGSSTFGSDAQKRLAKYRERFSVMSHHNPGDKLVSTITCSEAVILCYQLTFAEADPQFIQLDAAHTMPMELAKWLSTSPGWTQLQ